MDPYAMILFHFEEELESNCNSIPPDVLDFLQTSLTETKLQNKFGKPMVWIGIYIAIASLFCILPMLADLLHGLKHKKLWFPCKYFTLNAASLTVIAIAMKLPVDLNNSMPNNVDQAAKLGSLAFMCTMMANLLPSLATMDSKELLTNITALGVLVITLVVNVCIQIRTGVVSNNHDGPYYTYVSYKNWLIAVIYVAMLFVLLVIHTCLALMIITSKQIVESKYKARRETALVDLELQQPGRETVEKLKQHVSNHWEPSIYGSLFCYNLCFWDVPVVILTAIAISLPNIQKSMTHRLLKCVSGGLTYVKHVEESLNATDGYISSQKAARMLWLEIEVCHKWLGINLQTPAHETNATKEIVQWFCNTAENMVSELESKKMKGSDDSSVYISVSANSMYRITQTILASNHANIDQVSQEELFEQLSSMISHILAACLTNLPRVIAMKCHTSVIEKREESVHVAAQLLGETMQIINSLQDRELPSLNPDELPFIDKWRDCFLHPSP
ncbi:hypothetical protein Hanom_Chr08g00708191 [Helianthus anomalus]